MSFAIEPSLTAAAVVQGASLTFLLSWMDEAQPNLRTFENHHANRSSEVP